MHQALTGLLDPQYAGNIRGKVAAEDLATAGDSFRCRPQLIHLQLIHHLVWSLTAKPDSTNTCSCCPTPQHMQKIRQTCQLGQVAEACAATGDNSTHAVQLTGHPACVRVRAVVDNCRAHGNSLALKSYHPSSIIYLWHEAHLQPSPQPQPSPHLQPEGEPARRFHTGQRGTAHLWTRVLRNRKVRHPVCRKTVAE